MPAFPVGLLWRRHLWPCPLSWPGTPGEPAEGPWVSRDAVGPPFYQLGVQGKLRGGGESAEHVPSPGSQRQVKKKYKVNRK